MIRSRVFVFLAITLLLAGCASAEATSPPAVEVATETTAKEKVTELQGFTARVLEKAQKEFNDAESIKSDVESQKTKADNAESAVRTAAAAITAKERKSQADAIVRTAAEELGKCNILYQDANNKAQKASVSLNAFVTRARTLENEAKTKSVPASGQQEDYAEIIASAGTAKTQTTTLSGEIESSTDLSEAQTALVALSDCAKKIEVFKYQAESIAIVSQIETALKTAETDIQNIPQKREEINTIVQAMNTKCEGATDTSKSSLSQLCTTAESQLQTATTKVQEAQQCNTDMHGQKTQLDATLATLVTLKDATEEDQATQEAANVKGHEAFIDSELQKIKQALLAADNALRSATEMQQQMQDEISKHNSQSGTKLKGGNPQDNARTAEVTKTIQSGKAKNPKITETDKTALGKPKGTIDKTSEQPVNTHLGKTEQNKSTQLAHNEKQNPKDDKSELLNKDELRNITKDITNNPLVGGEVPTRSAANDSAVTVFIPLLVILVISAVLH